MTWSLFKEIKAEKPTAKETKATNHRQKWKLMRLLITTSHVRENGDPVNMWLL
jgi:hypothetical protein